jgi:hypothetical protein
VGTLQCYRTDVEKVLPTKNAASLELQVCLTHRSLRCYVYETPRRLLIH